MGEGNAVSMLSPRVLQAFLWPVHNVFLCTWISLILTTIYLDSMVTMIQTLLFGAKRTNAPLGRLFMEEVSPSARAVESLCEQHQVIGVRVSGLVLMPLMMLCDFAVSVVGKVGILVGSLVFVGMGLFSWWYWVCSTNFELFDISTEFDGWFITIETHMFFVISCCLPTCCISYCVPKTNTLSLVVRFAMAYFMWIVLIYHEWMVLWFDRVGWQLRVGSAIKSAWNFINIMHIIQF